MDELKGNFKAAYDVVKRAERCVLLRSKRRTHHTPTPWATWTATALYSALC